VPDTYVKKADRERESRNKKVVHVLESICDDPSADPATKLGAAKQLKTIGQLREQISVKDQQISQKDEQISQKDEQVRELKAQLEINGEKLVAAAAELKVALEDRKNHEQKIDL
jgi:uncharacterized protein (DUF3084 family)